MLTSWKGSGVVTKNVQHAKTVWQVFEIIVVKQVLPDSFFFFKRGHKFALGLGKFPTQQFVELKFVRNGGKSQAR